MSHRACCWSMVPYRNFFTLFFVLYLLYGFVSTFLITSIPVRTYNVHVYYMYDLLYGPTFYSLLREKFNIRHSIHIRDVYSWISFDLDMQNVHWSISCIEWNLNVFSNSFNTSTFKEQANKLFCLSKSTGLSLFRIKVVMCIPVLCFSDILFIFDWKNFLCWTKKKSF